MNQSYQVKSTGKLQRIVFWVLLLFLSYTIIGSLVLPSVIKIIAIKNIEDNLNREASINIVMFNPFALSLTMKGLTIKDNEGDSGFVSIKDIYVNLQSLSIFKFAPIIKSVTVDYPYLSITRYKNGKLNFNDLIETFTAESVTEEKSSDKNETESEMFRFSLCNLLISNGHVDILDQQTGKTHKIDKLNLSVPFTSTIGHDIERFTEMQLSMDFDNAAVSVFGKTKPFTDTMETSIDVSLDGLDISNYFEYIPFETDIVLSSATIDAKNSIYFANTEGKGAELSITGDVIVKDIAVIDKENNPFFKLDLNHIVLSRSNLLKGEIAFGSILMESPHLWINRSSSGTININKLIEQLIWSETPEFSSTFDEIVLTIEGLDIKDSRVFIDDLFQTTKADKLVTMQIFNMDKININNIVYEMANQSVTISEVLTNNGQFYAQRLPNGDLNIDLFTNIGVNIGADTESTGSGLTDDTSFLVELKKLGVDDFSLFCTNIVDEQNNDIVIRVVNMKGENISTRPDSKGNIEIACKLNETADIDVTGEFCIEPLKMDMKMSVSDIDIMLFQPFISYFVEDAPDITISSGKLSSDGAFSFALSDSNNITGGFRGDAIISGFLLSDNNNEKLVEFGTLNIRDAEAEIEPFFANVQRIAINDFKCFASINEDGVVNFQNIFSVTETVETELNNSSVVETEIIKGNENSRLNIEDKIIDYINEYTVNLNELSIDNSSISFIDYSIKPNFSMEISDISGKVTNFSTEKSSDAIIEVKAKINNYAPAKIGGSINMLEEKPFANITIELKDMDLTVLSPYTAKYIGYNVRKGTLSLDLSYLIELINLDSQNNLLVGQFELGERVKSPDAIKVPVKLGLALLKDRKGMINLDIPLSGRIDDPEFDIGGVIVSTIKNLIVKAATSPFKFIASIFGGSEDIKFIEFLAGRVLLNREARSKLDIIIEALYERPGIDLEIAGFIDKDEDVKTMISNKLKKMIKSEKFKRMIKSEKSGTSIDDINLNIDEYEKYLKTLYKTKYAVDTTVKDVTMPEIESLVKSKIKITDNELKLLMDNRVQTVRSYILASGKVGGERIFLIKSKNINPENVEDIKNSRVELGLK